MLNEFDCLRGIYNYESYNELINHYNYINKGTLKCLYVNIYT